MVRKRKKKKKKGQLVHIPRGGFSSGLPNYNDPRSWIGEIGRQVDWNSLARQAGQEGMSYAKKFVTESAKKTKVRVGKTLLEMVKAPGAGIVNPTKTKTLKEESAERYTISGSNRLFTAHKYVWKVDIGNEPGRWMRNAILDGGKTKLKFKDTVEHLDMDSSWRPELSKEFGFNQKLQWFIEAEHFGFRHDDLDALFNKAQYESSSIAEQIAYGGIYNLQSVATITNMNSFVPIKLKVSLVSFIRDENPSKVVTTAANAILGIQRDGSMPVVNQFSTVDTNPIGNCIHVNPDSQGIKAANIMKDECQVVASKTFRLAAGDHLEVDYNHKSGSGIRIDKLFGYDANIGANMANPITYALLIEASGEPVELVKNAERTRVMKGTSIGNISCEFKKIIHGARADAGIFNSTNVGTTGGWTSTKLAARVLSNTTTATVTQQKFNTDHSNVGSGLTYSIPLMSDSINQEQATNN